MEFSHSLWVSDDPARLGGFVDIAGAAEAPDEQGRKGNTA